MLVFSTIIIFDEVIISNNNILRVKQIVIFPFTRVKGAQLISGFLCCRNPKLAARNDVKVMLKAGFKKPELLAPVELTS